MSTSPASSIVAFATGLVAGLSVNGIVAFIQRPIIEIASDDDRYDQKSPDHYLHVTVRNKKHRIFNRNMAVDCESQVWIADTETGMIKEGSPFKTKWERLSNLTYVDSTRRLEWMPIPALETRINIYPGLGDGGREGLQLDIVKKNKSVCLVHDPEVYHAPPFQREKWRLKEGTYFVRVTILYAQKTSDSALFLLTNGKTLGTTTLVTCPLNKLGRAKQIFGLIDTQRHPRNFDSKSEDIWS
jgi:hypothetical protein